MLDSLWVSNSRADMTLPADLRNPPTRGRSWTNRITIAAVVGILFLTLYPFHFSLQTELPPGASPFLLGADSKSGKPLGIVLNILLFIPFGFGLSAKLRERRMPGPWIFLTVWITGSVFSYFIEFVQIYIPARGSGWDDVLTNSAGSALGSILFLFSGFCLLGLLSRSESVFEDWLKPGRTVFLLVAWIGFWSLLSAYLQTQASLQNWSTECLLLLGNDSTGHEPWKGTLSRLQIWDRALPRASLKSIATGANSSADERGLVADIVFTGAGPYCDQKNAGAALAWTPSAAPATTLTEAVLDGRSWLTSDMPVSSLVQDLRQTNQFSLRLALAAASGTSAGRIFSISRPGLTDIYAEQSGADLVFWFRTPLSVKKRAYLAQRVSNVFSDRLQHDLVFAYDGLNLAAYVDGKQDPHMYELTPGAGLARRFIRIRADELAGYADVYYAIVFVPLGALLGLAARRQLSQKGVSFGVLVLSLCLSAVVLEIVLSTVSGGVPSTQKVMSSLALILAGTAWMHADPAGRHP